MKLNSNENNLFKPFKPLKLFKQFELFLCNPAFCLFSRFSSLTGLALIILLATVAPVLPIALEQQNIITISSEGDAGLRNPLSISYDELRGFLIVANTGGQRVMALNRGGAVVKVFGRGNDLQLPHAVTVTNEGDLLIAERGSESIKFLSQYYSGSDEEYNKLDLSQYRRIGKVQPSSLFVNKDGKLYVADRYNRQILIFGSDRKFRFSITDIGEPTDIWVSYGKIFLSDSGFGGIRVYSEEGGMLPALGLSPARFREPLRVKALAADRRGRIWVIEESGGIKAIDSFDNLLLTIKPEASGLFSPVDMTIDENNNLYVLEQGGNRISVFHIAE